MVSCTTCAQLREGGQVECIVVGDIEGVSRGVLENQWGEGRGGGRHCPCICRARFVGARGMGTVVARRLVRAEVAVDAGPCWFGRFVASHSGYS